MAMVWALPVRNKCGHFLDTQERNSTAIFSTVARIEPNPVFVVAQGSQ